MHSKNGLWTLFAVIIGLAYIITSFSPLRLTNDTVRYFTLLETQLGTWPTEFGKVDDFLPWGYVYFLVGLERLHILLPWVICFFQILYLTGSLYFVKRLFGPTLQTAPFVCFVLLSWAILKFTITPLSEIQFLFFSTGSICYYQLFITGRRPVHLVLLIIFCGMGILTRTAGIALLTALLLSFLISTKKQWLFWLKQHLVLTLCIVLTMIALLTFIVIQPKVITYLAYFFRPLTRDPGAFVTRNIRLHLIDWAELFLNIPYSKTGFLLPDLWRGLLYILAGLFFLWLVGRKMLAKKANIPLPVKVYVMIYALLIFNWPFFEARFWLPLIPFIAAILLRQEQGSRSIKAAVLYAGFYLLSGVFVLGYYIDLSFDRQALVNKHDAGKWKQEYEYHFGINNKVDSATMNFKALYLLEKYNR
jgi:hypothetical protein